MNLEHFEHAFARICVWYKYTILMANLRTVTSGERTTLCKGHSNQYSCFWSGDFPGIDMGGWVLSNLETKYFDTKHNGSLTPYQQPSEVYTYKKKDKAEACNMTEFARLMAIDTTDLPRDLQLTVNPPYCACAEVKLLKLHKV